ncbi:MAG: TonB-dependent receptor domain-containing protein [Acidobacteriaceae bacterium]
MFLATGPLYGQTDTARIQGSVTDTTGAAIPGATVTVTNRDTNAAVTITSDGSGNFSIPALPRGNYEARVTDTGFTAQVQDFTLNVSQAQTLAFRLQPGEATTTVTVTDAAPLVETASSSIGEVIQGRQVTELPLNGRNFTQLALLTPGVTRGNYGNGASGVNGDAETFRNQESGGGSLSTNGLRPQANNYLLDGIDNNESLVNTIVFFPNIDATQEFRVNTSTAPAEYGRAGGAIVQSSIKSGTNSIHGSAFEFLRNSAFDANPNYQFLGAGPTPALPFKRNQFGGAVGFPIIKDKLFLFGDYQGYRESTPLNAQILTVPTQAMRGGDFSQLVGLSGVNNLAGASVTGCPSYTLANGTVLLNQKLGSSGSTQVNDSANGAIFDPTTCAQWNYGGRPNVMDPARLNPVAQKYLNAYPLANVPGTNNGTQNNYRTIRQQVSHYNTFDARLDYNATVRDLLFARFSYDNSQFTRTSEFPNLPAGFASGSNNVHARGYEVGYDHTFTPTVINQFRAGYTRYTLTNVPVFSNIPISANLGIVNANRTPQLYGGALIGGYGNELEYTGDYGTYAVPENTYELVDAVSVVRGKHQFKFGANGIRRDVAFFRPIAGKGYFQLSGGDFTGYNVSELLTGFTDTYSIGAQTGFFGTRNYEIGVYGEDNWKVNERLTLNLGLRYDILTWPTEEHNRQSALNPNTGQIELAGVNGVPRSLNDTSYGNVGPRIGFAYDLSGQGKTVLRGGYGIFYYLDRGGIDNQFGQQVPFGGSVGYTAGAGYRVTFTGQSPLNNNDNLLATNPLPLPGFPNFNPAVPPAGINVIATNRNNKIPSVQQYDLQLQQQVGSNTVFTLGYVGNKADHQTTSYNYNTMTIDGGPRPFPNLGQINYNLDNGISNYNSLQTRLDHRFAHGLSFTASYTWSHTLNNSDGLYGFFTPSPLYYPDQRRDYGNSTLDQRNVFTFSDLYELPFGRGRRFGANWNRGLDAVAGGWQINTIVTLESGTPYTIQYNDYGGNYSPLPVLTGVVSQPRSISGQWFDPSNFSRPATGSDGNIPRNYLAGPGYKDLDLSVFKNFLIAERVNTELRGEVYNLTNTPAFTNPDGNLEDGTAGKVTGTREYSERQIQLAIRFTF